MKTARFTALAATAALAVAVPALSGTARAADPPFEVRLEKVGTYGAGVFDEGGAEISAYDPSKKRLYVVNGRSAGPRIDILDLRRPTTPTLAGSIDVTAYGGAANSVAVHGSTVAIAIQAVVKTDPGKVVFFSTKGDFLSSVTVGALPDMLAFTPNGKKVVVCNEGEPDDAYAADPEGTVSIIDIPKGGAKKVTQANVTTIGFTQFDGQTLDPSIRVFGLAPTAAKSFEPEYAAISPDSKTAWVTIQESNAVAVIDLTTNSLKSLAGLGFKDHGTIAMDSATYTFPQLDPIGTTEGGTVLRGGGFSGLLFEGRDAATGRLKFLTHTDRGPNAEPKDLTGDMVNDRPFPLPAFQPRWVRFEVDETAGTVTVTGETLLTKPDGSPLTGISNALGANGFAHSDENPVDAKGRPIPLDPLGADLEGIVKASDGTYWMCDEYRPSLYHFDANGKMIARFVPTGSPVGTGTEALPAVYAQRRANRGFEAIAIQGTKVFAWIQSPIDNPDTGNDASSKASRNCRIVEFDTATNTTTAEYVYVQDAGSDKMGDAVAVGPGEFLVVERDDLTGAAAKKKVWRVSLANATKISSTQSLTLEGTADLAGAGIRPVLKMLHSDLAIDGYAAVDKVEGIALIDAHTIALVNDNDFGLDGTIDAAAGTVGLKASAPILLGILRARTNGLDASDRDGGINIRPWPVKGMYQPDTVAAFRVKKTDYIVMANEGDTRVWGDFDEEARVKDLTLDPVAFPSFATLRADSALGRLTVTNTLGDTDGDDDFDELYVFGTRSFSIRDAAGALVWDSGEQIERIVAELNPARFNSAHDANDFDSRSDNKGPEPEGLTVATLFGRTYALVGLERACGVMTWDITDPTAPTFVDYVNPRDYSADPTTPAAGDLGPEGVLFIAAGKSPTRKPMVVVTNEISGTTTLFNVVKVRKSKR